MRTDHVPAIFEVFSTNQTNAFLRNLVVAVFVFALVMGTELFGRVFVEVAQQASVFESLSARVGDVEVVFPMRHDLLFFGERLIDF